MSIESLLEDSIIADFQRDPVLQAQTIRKHDYGGALAGVDHPLDPEVPAVIIVTATDRGEMKMGSGIKFVGVEVRIRVNGEADNFNGTLLDNLKELIDFRLMPTPSVTLSGRENALSTDALKVFGIMMNADVTQRIEQGLERIRIVPRTFIASKLL